MRKEPKADTLIYFLADKSDMRRYKKTGSTRDCCRICYLHVMDIQTERVNITKKIACNDDHNKQQIKKCSFFAPLKMNSVASLWVFKLIELFFSTFFILLRTFCTEDVKMLIKLKSDQLFSVWNAIRIFKFSLICSK